MSENNFIKLAMVDTSRHIEKKQNLSYLSWPFAIDQLMRHDPTANWEFHTPDMYNDTMMVSCTVTAFGKPMKMHLPVMDHRNQAIKNPDAFAVNKNMMRCLVKAIACHGLGLHIYAGEDLPMDEDGNAAVRKPEPKVEKKPEPKPEPKQEIPEKMEGKPGPWQIIVSTDPGSDPKNWVEVVCEAAEIQINLAKNKDDVLSIYKVNQVIFEQLKKQSQENYELIMNVFKNAKAKFQ